MKAQHNTESRGVVVAAGMAVVGILLLILPGLLGMDGMSGGYALGFVGVFVIISGLIVAGIYVPRATRLNAILSGRDLLVHWRYDQMTVTSQVARDRKQRLEENRSLFLIVAAWMIGITALLTVIGYLSGEGDDLILFVATMLSVLVVIAAAAFGMPYLLARQALRSGHEAYIGSQGVYLNGTFYAWNPPLSRKDDVRLRQDADGARLVFSLRIVTGPGWLHWQPYTVEVPVPAGEEDAAQRVVRQLRP